MLANTSTISSKIQEAKKRKSALQPASTRAHPGECTRVVARTRLATGKVCE
jgi:hypothetical protein